MLSLQPHQSLTPTNAGKKTKPTNFYKENTLALTTVGFVHLPPLPPSVHVCLLALSSSVIVVVVCLFVFGRLAGCVSVVFVVGFFLVLSFFVSFCVCVWKFIPRLSVSLSGWCLLLVFSVSLCVSVTVAGVRCWVFEGVVSEVVECWGFLHFFFSLRRFNVFWGGCSLLRESFRLGGCLIVAPEKRKKRNSYLGFFFFFFL